MAEALGQTTEKQSDLEITFKLNHITNARPPITTAVDGSRYIVEDAVFFKRGANHPQDLHEADYVVLEAMERFVADWRYELQRQARQQQRKAEGGAV